jgi:hypothetical protein
MDDPFSSGSQNGIIVVAVDNSLQEKDETLYSCSLCILSNGTNNAVHFCM